MRSSMQPKVGPIIWWSVGVCFFGLVCGSASAEWFKGVTHVHSLWSDGDMAPEMIAAWYKERGYNFVCCSEHSLLQEVDNVVMPARGRTLRDAEGAAAAREIGGTPASPTTPSKPSEPKSATNTVSPAGYQGEWTAAWWPP